MVLHQNRLNQKRFLDALSVVREPYFWLAVAAIVLFALCVLAAILE